jgi:acetyl esterase/lipase
MKEFRRPAAQLGWAGWVIALAMSLAMTPRGVAAEDSVPKPETLALWDHHAPVGDGTFSTEDAEVTLHRAAHPNGAAVVICPGGGYGGLVMGAEGHLIAEWLNRHGITGIVLQYRLPQGRPMVPLLDAQRALRLVRWHSQEWGIDSHRIGIAGFSAGGHLASTAGTHFDEGRPEAGEPVERMSCRPDFMILVYPVITMGEQGHGGSRKNLMGPAPIQETIEQFSNEKQVTARTPPAFLAHAQDDKTVAPVNSQMFFDALQAHHVPAKYLPLPQGGHGLNGYRGPMWDEWQSQSLQWLADQKFIRPSDVATAP